MSRFGTRIVSNRRDRFQPNAAASDDNNNNNDSKTTTSVLEKLQRSVSMTPFGSGDEEKTKKHVDKNDDDNNNKYNNGDDGDDDESPAGVVGAQFFGGNKQKEEFFDPDAEAAAGLDWVATATIIPMTTTAMTTINMMDSQTNTSLMVDDSNRAADDSIQPGMDTNDRILKYWRFADRAAFGGEGIGNDDGIETSTLVAELAQDLQQQVSNLLYEDQDEKTSIISAIAPLYSYTNNLQWDTPFPGIARSSSQEGTSMANPLDALRQAKMFYRHLDVAITSGRALSGHSNHNSHLHNVELRWEISVAWPIFWEPRILLTGTSNITVDIKKKHIVRQQDTLDQTDLVGNLVRQLLPRFWDVYHIGMTPSAEVAPRWAPVSVRSPSFFSQYRLYQIPPRLVWEPTILDQTGSREDGMAATLPNHAFACVIKTMGPTRQRYVPTSPIQVQITAAQVDDGQQQQQQSSGLRITWQVPLSVEYIARSSSDNNNNKNGQSVFLVPRDTDPDSIQAQAKGDFKWYPTRHVATMSYGEDPQDITITAVRKTLYEQVIRDGFKPKTDASGRPLFFYWYNTVKACYTEQGLGMTVYEWRPSFIKPNEVGIELEI